MTLEDPKLLLSAANALVMDRRLTEADSVLRVAVISFPENLGLAFEYARNAARLKNREDEAYRWQVLQRQFPTFVHGYLGFSQMCRRESRFNEAEETLLRGIQAVGQDRRLLTEYAICANVQENWREAQLRWAVLEQVCGLDPGSHRGFARALSHSGEIRAAETLLRRGLDNFPNNDEITVGLAELASARQDWAAANGYWRCLTDRNPDNKYYIDNLGLTAWHLSMRQVEPSDDLHSSFEIGRTEDAEVRELVLRFESLGQDCEFGLVQRRFGAEPISLLRWTGTKPATLLKGLAGEFAGVGLLENTHLDVMKSEIMVNDTSIGGRFHTFTERAFVADLEIFRKKQARHLKYLRDMLVSRLCNPDKVFVYSCDKNVTEANIRDIYSALCKYGPASLLVVRAATTDHAAGSMETFGNLYFGYISRLGKMKNTWDIDFDGWTTICRRVRTEITMK